MTHRAAVWTPLALAASLLSGHAHAIVLDFGSGPTPPSVCSSTADGLGSTVACGDGSYLLQSYGDVAGVVDVSYMTPRLSPRSLRWWALNYNSLYGVAWADGSDADSRARIELKAADPLALVSLATLDLGAYSNTTRNTTLVITTIGGASTLYTYTGLVGDTSTNSATRFIVNVSAVGGLWIDWYDSAYNVGIDNITYSVSSAVPEPGAAAMLLAGVAAVSLLARRRRG